MKGCGERGADGNEAMRGAKGNGVRSAECGRGMLARTMRRRVNACFGREDMHAYECNGEMCVQSKRTEQNERQTRSAATYRCASQSKRTEQNERQTRRAAAYRCAKMCMHANIDGGHGWVYGSFAAGGLKL